MKRILTMLAFVATLAMAAPTLSHAAQGLYISPKIMLSVYNTGMVSREHLSGFGIGQTSKAAFGASVAAGYDFYPQQNLPLRAELELALRSNASDDWSGRSGKVESTWNSTTSFLNFYWDFHNETAFTPYVGAGLGMAFQYAGYDVKYADGSKMSMDDRYTTFAWNVGAGMSYAVNENLAVDLGYRFVSMGQHDINQNGTKVETNPYMNEVNVGARFMF